MICFATQIDPEVCICKRDEESGFMHMGSWKDVIRDPVDESVKSLLDQGVSFSFYLKHDYVNYEIEFHQEGSLPKTSITWDQERIQEIPVSEHLDFWDRMHTYAIACDAGYIIVADEALSSLECRISMTSEDLIFDMDENLPYARWVYDVWVRKSPDCPLPKGLKFVRSEEVDPGIFIKHDVEPFWN
ncbi:hypothetical protein [Planctopirus hydrillae]|uniref:Uncharacterized protein n=1 Tax=Planctopirus hydrillae TaxID=1841610 RepID=A0A1C3E698_9PLAN|nr:hypothetical protein [Planctopirus hydrillae]ODA28768.1 hypothetical protein A6X21_11000 [Planctopirus hydrillae]